MFGIGLAVVSIILILVAILIRYGGFSITGDEKDMTIANYSMIFGAALLSGAIMFTLVKKQRELSNSQ